MFTFNNYVYFLLKKNMQWNMDHFGQVSLICDSSYMLYSPLSFKVLPRYASAHNNNFIENQPKI